MATGRNKIRYCPHCGERYTRVEFVVMFRRDAEAPCRACRKTLSSHGPWLSRPRQRTIPAAADMGGGVKNSVEQAG